MAQHLCKFTGPRGGSEGLISVLRLTEVGRPHESVFVCHCRFIECVYYCVCVCVCLRQSAVLLFSTGTGSTWGDGSPLGLVCVRVCAWVLVSRMCMNVCVCVPLCCLFSISPQFVLCLFPSNTHTQTNAAQTLNHIIFCCGIVGANGQLGSQQRNSHKNTQTIMKQSVLLA